MADCCLIKKVATVEVYENKNEVRAYGFMAGDRNTPVMEVRFKHTWGVENLQDCKLRWVIVDDVGSLLIGEVPIQSDNTALINLPNELFTGDRRMKVQLTVASCDGERILNLQQFTDLKVINNLATNEVVQPVYQLLINQLYDDTKVYLTQLETSYSAKYGSLETLYANSKASLEQYLVTAENGGNAEFLQGYIPANFQKVENTINDLIASTKYSVGDVVEVLGYYAKGDGAGHPRIKKPTGYSGADAVIGADGSVWGIVYSGEVNVSWFGAKDDGVTDCADAIEKISTFATINKLNIILNKTVNGYYTTKGFKISQIEIIGSGRFTTTFFTDTDIKLVEVLSTLDFQEFFTQIRGFAHKSRVKGLGTMLYCESETQKLIGWKDIMGVNLNVGVHYKTKENMDFGSGTAYTVYEDSHFWANTGIYIEGESTLTKTWMNLVTFLNVHTGSCKDGFLFKNVWGLEAIKFINCSLNEGSQKYSGTIESNYVSGVRFDNCVVSSVNLDSCYLENINPARKATDSEVTEMETGADVYSYLDTAIGGIVTLHKKNGKIYNKEHKTICGDRFDKQGCIAFEDTDVKEFSVDNCAINQNQVVLSYYSPNVGKRKNKTKISFKNINGLFADPERMHNQFDYGFFHFNVTDPDTITLDLDLQGVDFSENHKIFSKDTQKGIKITSASIGNKTNYSTISSNIENNEYYFSSTGVVNGMGNKFNPRYIQEISEIFTYCDLDYNIVNIEGTFNWNRVTAKQFKGRKYRITSTNGAVINITNIDFEIVFLNELNIEFENITFNFDGINGDKIIANYTMLSNLFFRNCTINCTLPSPKYFVASNLNNDVNLVIENLTLNSNNNLAFAAYSNVMIPYGKTYNYGTFVNYSRPRSSSITSLDTPYHATQMSRLGILDSYHNYLTELHEYEKSQNVQSDSEIMNLNVLQPPVIPTEVEAYAKEYNLI